MKYDSNARNDLMEFTCYKDFLGKHFYSTFTTLSKHCERHLHLKMTQLEAAKHALCRQIQATYP